MPKKPEEAAAQVEKNKAVLEMAKGDGVTSKEVIAKFGGHAGATALLLNRLMKKGLLEKTTGERDGVGIYVAKNVEGTAKPSKPSSKKKVEKVAPKTKKPVKKPSKASPAVHKSVANLLAGKEDPLAPLDNQYLGDSADASKPKCGEALGINGSSSKPKTTPTNRIAGHFPAPASEVKKITADEVMKSVEGDAPVVASPEELGVAIGVFLRNLDSAMADFARGMAKGLGQ